MIRLDKLLADMNCGTRSELKKDIRKGLASVDGVPVKDPGFLLRGSERILFRGEPVVYEEKTYLMMNKPSGVITATEDKKQKTVLDLLDKSYRKDLFPVGRLDKDTEGLLLITNDGELAHHLLSPRHHVNKTYYAKVEGFLTDRDIFAFSDGLMLSEDFQTMPSRLEILRSGEISEAKITIQEGKFHQVKRMFHAVGKEVVYLKRISMGPLALDDDLAPGDYRRLTEDEMFALKEMK